MLLHSRLSTSHPCTPLLNPPILITPHPDIPLQPFHSLCPLSSFPSLQSSPLPRCLSLHIPLPLIYHYHNLFLLFTSVFHPIEVFMPEPPRQNISLTSTSLSPLHSTSLSLNSCSLTSSLKFFWPPSAQSRVAQCLVSVKGGTKSTSASLFSASSCRACSGCCTTVVYLSFYGSLGLNCSEERDKESVLLLHTLR